MGSRKQKEARDAALARARSFKNQRRQESRSETFDSSGPVASEGSSAIDAEVDAVPARPARKPRPIIVGNMSPKALQARKKAQFEAEAKRILEEGILWDRCDYCEKFSKRCRIALYNKARQRTMHCYECFLRSKPCSHNDADSEFRKQLKGIRERQDLAEGNLAAISRREEQEAAEKQMALEREEQLLSRAEALKREEFRVRADEAATQRAVVRAQLRWQAGEQAGPARKLAGGSRSPIVEELTDSEDSED